MDLDSNSLILITSILGLGIVVICYFMLTKKSGDSPRKEAPKANGVKSKSNTFPENPRSFVNVMKRTGKKIVIFFGSQSGTAEKFANEIAELSNKKGIDCLVLDPLQQEMGDLTKLNLIENSVAIFCLATYGDGEPTDNTMDFNEWLKDNDEKLDKLQYTVFGLGNVTYEHYNAMGKYVDERLEELGADRIHELGLGDDSEGKVAADFIPWKTNLVQFLCTKYGVDKTNIEE